MDPVNEDRDLALELWASLTGVRRTVRRIARRPFSLRALTGAELELVRVVDQKPGTSVAEAARELGVAPNTVSTLVRHLTENGVVERRVGETDRRIIRLDLTADVRREIDAWEDRRIVMLADTLKRIPAADRKRLAAALPVLRKIADDLEATAD